MEFEPNAKPKARTLGLIVQSLPDETLVYDKDRHQAHCLNKTAALVWQHCDGTNTLTAIADQLTAELQAQVSEEIVLLAVAKLSRRHLIIHSESSKKVRSGLTRREVLRKLGVGAAIAIPVITSILTPTAAQAGSCLPAGATCSTSAECCSGVCNVNTCV